MISVFLEKRTTTKDDSGFILQEQTEAANYESTKNYYKLDSENIGEFYQDIKLKKTLQKLPYEFTAAYFLGKYTDVAVGMAYLSSTKAYDINKLVRETPVAWQKGYTISHELQQCYGSYLETWNIYNRNGKNIHTEYIITPVGP